MEYSNSAYTHRSYSMICIVSNPEKERVSTSVCRATGMRFLLQSDPGDSLGIVALVLAITVQ